MTMNKLLWLLLLLLVLNLIWNEKKIKPIKNNWISLMWTVDDSTHIHKRGIDLF